MRFRNALPSKKCRRWELNNGVATDFIMGSIVKLKQKDLEGHDWLLNLTVKASKVKAEP